jgi:hypothetical protein
MKIEKFVIKNLNESVVGICNFKGSKILEIISFRDYIVNGYEFINTKYINIEKKNRRDVLFLKEIIKINNIKIPWRSFVQSDIKFSDLLAILKGVISVEFVVKDESPIYLVGYVEVICKDKFGLRYIDPVGNVDKKKLDWIKFKDIIRIQYKNNYLKTFEKYHRHYKIRPADIVVVDEK